jgi:hypothetical protein
MASLSEMIEYAKAKQPRNGLAEMAGHFIQGASSGYDAGKKAKLDAIESILKTAQAQEAIQKARELKTKNDLWQSVMDQGKAQGDIPLTAGEMMNGRVVMGKNIGEKANATRSATTLSRLAEIFTTNDPNKTSITKINLPGGLGTVTTGPKRTFKPSESSSTATAREDRILHEKVLKMALQMTQSEDPMAPVPNPKYLRLAYTHYGKNPDDYIPKKPLELPTDNDPWALFGQDQGGE